MEQVTYNGLTFEPYILREQIDKRIKELAATITTDCGGKMPLFLCVLNGAFPFASDLFRAVDFDAEISFIRLKSYSGMGSTGEVKEVVGLTEDIKGRTVIVIEDIVDTGKTMQNMLETLGTREPASVQIASLFVKPARLKVPVDVKYGVFTIPDRFIVGFGLDYDRLGRNLPDIYDVVE